VSRPTDFTVTVKPPSHLKLPLAPAHKWAQNPAMQGRPRGSKLRKNALDRCPNIILDLLHSLHQCLRLKTVVRDARGQDGLETPTGGNTRRPDCAAIANICIMNACLKRFVMEDGKVFGAACMGSAEKKGVWRRGQPAVPSSKGPRIVKRGSRRFLPRNHGASPNPSGNRKVKSKV
jgi:hypothetical protein